MAVPQSFETARLAADRIAPAHLAALQQLHRDPEAMAGLGGVRSDDETQRYLARNLSHWETHGFGVWMLRERGGEAPIGRVALRWLSTADLHDVEIGFALLPEHWGRGFATEAGGFARDLARFELGLASLVGVTLPDNHASRRVLEKLGLERDGETVVGETTCLVHRVTW